MSSDVVRKYVERHGVTEASRIVSSMTRRSGLNLDEKQDIIQQACVNAIYYANSFNPTFGRVDAWFAKIVRGCIFSASRQKTRIFTKVKRITLLDPPADYPSPEHSVIENDSLKRAFDAIEEINPSFRACLKLYVYDGLSSPEIAEILGIPVKTVRTRIFRAREALGKLLPEFE